jgi:SNF2 family DNA or RNA helicase
VDYLAAKQRSCLSCGAPLWQFTNLARQAQAEEHPGFALEQVQHLVQAGKWSFFHQSTPSPARWPLADYIVRRYPRLFKMLVVDETHQYKGESADRAYAFGLLVNTIPATLLLTGTLFGGMAPSLFYLLYRIDGRLRRLFEYEDVQGFTERYGVLEREVRYYDEVGDDGHSMAGNRRRRTTVRPRPGISPEMVTLLLDTTIFVRVADLGVRLPPKEEIPITLEMDERHKAKYDAFYTKAIEALKEAKEYKVDLAGSFLQNLMGYCTAPFRIHEITSTDEDGQVEVWASAPDLEIVCGHCGQPLEALNAYCLDCHPEFAEDEEDEEAEGMPTADHMRELLYDDGGNLKSLDEIDKDEATKLLGPFLPGQKHGPDKVFQCTEGCGVKRTRIFPKERWLINLVKAERAQGRKVIVFCRQTATRDITERLAGLLEAEGLRTLRLGSVSAEKREAWLNQQVRRGLDVFLVNPKSVETGLDLVAFSTGVFYEVDFSLYTMWQAARRLWRLGQTQDVRIYYPVQKGTLMEKAAALVKQKMAAALMLYGDNVETVMGQANEGSLLQELTKAAVEGAEVEDLATIFARHNPSTSSGHSTEQIGGSGYLMAGGQEPDPLRDAITECLLSTPDEPEKHRVPTQVVAATQLAFAV